MTRAIIIIIMKDLISYVFMIEHYFHPYKEIRRFFTNYSHVFVSLCNDCIDVLST